MKTKAKLEALHVGECRGVERVRYPDDYLLSLVAARQPGFQTNCLRLFLFKLL